MTLLRCSVDASRAGQGPLIIDITYNGQLIPAHIAQDPHRDKQFNVKFKPRGAGYYTVRIFFSDVEITGTFTHICVYSVLPAAVALSFVCIFLYSPKKSSKLYSSNKACEQQT